VAFEIGWLFAGKVTRPQADKARAKNHDLKKRHMLIKTQDHHGIDFSLSPNTDSFSNILGGYFRKASGKMKKNQELGQRVDSNEMLLWVGGKRASADTLTHIHGYRRTDYEHELFPHTGIGLWSQCAFKLTSAQLRWCVSRCEAHRVAARPDPPACQSYCDLPYLCVSRNWGQVTVNHVVGAIEPPVGHGPLPPLIMDVFPAIDIKRIPDGQRRKISGKSIPEMGFTPGANVRPVRSKRFARGCGLKPSLQCKFEHRRLAFQ
jgi:hypothetical protein